MDKAYIDKICGVADTQKVYFRSGVTLNIRFRKQMLRKFLVALEKWEQRLYDALWADLHKSYEEALLTEISIVKAFLAIMVVMYDIIGNGEEILIVLEVGLLNCLCVP